MRIYTSYFGSGRLVPLLREDDFYIGYIGYCRCVKHWHKFDKYRLKEDMARIRIGGGA